MIRVPSLRSIGKILTKRSNCLVAAETKTKESQTVVAVWLLLKCCNMFSGCRRRVRR